MPTYLVKAIVLVLVATLSTGCTREEKRVLFDGTYYPGKARADRDDRRDFTASVRRASRGIEGAQKAVVYEATRYCVVNFGTSEVAWPRRTGADAGPVFERSGNTVSVRGRCVIWK